MFVLTSKFKTHYTYLQVQNVVTIATDVTNAIKDDDVVRACNILRQLGATLAYNGNYYL
jgi:hypothetical protein